MSKIVTIDFCFQCKYFNELERRSGISKGYCLNKINKNIPDVRKIIINPKYEGSEDRIYPLIEYNDIPYWCKLENTKE